MSNTKKIKLNPEDKALAVDAFDSFCRLRETFSWRMFIREKLPKLMFELKTDEKFIIMNDEKHVMTFIKTDDNKWVTVGQELSSLDMIKTVIVAGSKSAIIFNSVHGWRPSWYRDQMHPGDKKPPAYSE